MSDIDAITEINHQFLIIEWKTCQNLPMGQMVLYKRMTKYPAFTVLIICGDSESMDISAMQVIQNRKVGQWQKANFDIVYAFIKDWATSTAAICRKDDLAAESAEHAERGPRFELMPHKSAGDDSPAPAGCFSARRPQAPSQPNARASKGAGR